MFCSVYHALKFLDEILVETQSEIKEDREAWQVNVELLPPQPLEKSGQ